ncbi:ABC transporter permease [Candidatus Bathyarchaeota archaeon]|nr:ABC transporter permease [Candidatus Bathyarchaeota archaeon]RJS86890.1 MAG: ABC transporter permease [Candidatus Bathyarchaeota archaeon]
MIPPILKNLLRIKKFDISVSIILFITLVGIIGPFVYTVDPTALHAPPEVPPNNKYPLGTDSYGRDLLAQLLHGIRSSLYIGLTASLISLAIGVTIGAVAGFKGGITDDSLMLVTNVVYALPSIMLMMLIAAYLKERNPLFVALIIGLTSWPWVARAVRSQLMSLKSRDFLAISRMAALSDLKIMFEDLIPNMASYIFMAFVLLMSGAMIAEAGLSMIGLGVTRGVSLGIILYWAQLLESVRRGLWWWFIPPGACLVSLATSMLLLSTSLDEYFSPRLRGR